ncbi:probable GH family 25 lysozyme 3 isoform X1 [Drosophila tropicalis]|uniref:probable GH family 25 lysozyme 3 isoform X1 n=1 Tax=Drosophila tropicalis TaxID=46794 RepID=UPI0035ABD813
MWKLLVICVVMSALNSEAASGTSRQASRRRRAYAGGYAGGYASSGGGAGGYTGSYNSAGGGIGHSSYVGNGNGGYNDYDDYGDAGFSPNFGIIDPYLFHQQLTNHILAQNYANQQAVTGLATAGNAYASADATIDNDDTRIQQQIAAQQAYHDNLVRQNRYRGGNVNYGGGSSYNTHRYAPSYASASGSIGPNGFRQTAYINPANPNTPNIVNRFGGSSSGGGGYSSSSSSSSSGGGGGGGGGYKGVSVSSFSQSNGDGTSRRGAQTTVNDNGKVTSYSVHS